MIKYLLIISLFVSCVPNHQEHIEPDLLPYYRAFQVEADRLGVNIPGKSIVIVYKSLTDERAHCHIGKTSIKICVNSNFFHVDPDIYDYKLEATIFHELGHGLLNRSHIDPIDGIETSLMTVPGMRNDWISGEKRQYYLRELFGINQL